MTHVTHPIFVTHLTHDPWPIDPFPALSCALHSIFLVLRPNFAEFRSSSRMMELNRGTPVKSDNVNQCPAITQKRCEIWYTPCHKNRANLFLSELPQISANFDNFSRKMAKRLKLCEAHWFSTSRHRTTVLNADVPYCYTTLKVVIIIIIIIIIIIFYFHLKNQTRYCAITYRIIAMMDCQKSKCSLSWQSITTFTCIVNIQTFTPAFTQTHSVPTIQTSKRPK